MDMANIMVAMPRYQQMGTAAGKDIFSDLPCEAFSTMASAS